MPYTTSSQWGPAETPSVVRWLLIATCTITLLSALLNPLFHLANLLGPQELLALSWQGIDRLYFWQPISYMFVQDISSGGIHFFFLIALFFNMYILWVLGSMLCEDTGAKHFLIIYFFSAIIAGLAAISVGKLFGQYDLLFGPSAGLLALFTVWAMQYSDSILSLFFLIPMKTKWLYSWLLGIICLFSLTSLDAISFTLYLVAALFGYLYGSIVLNLAPPFIWLRGFDDQLKKLREYFLRKSPQTSSKIMNMKGEAVQSDDEFVDAMLTKISKRGESSLSFSERERMRKISEKKMKKER